MAYHPRMPFAPGQHVLYRGPHVDDSGLTGGPVICDVKPAVVVEDSAAMVALYVPAGTPTLYSRPLPTGRPKPWGPGEWELAPGSWDRWHAVFLHRPGEWRAVWVLWAPDWSFSGWYVNLQEPLWRTRWGFDIRDLQLDIVVSPDGSWRWKDQHDFDRSIATGLISDANAEATRRSAAEAIRATESQASPFDGSWLSWRPDPSWSIPRLPVGDHLRAALEWSASDGLERY